MRNDFYAWCQAFVVGCIFITVAAAQTAKPRVSAHLSAGVVKLGSQVEIIVVIEGGSSGRIDEIPEIEGLTLGQPVGPSVERSMRSIGGRVTVERRATWSIPITLQRAGDFVIPPFQVSAGKDQFNTQAMQLRVREDLEGAELGYMDLKLSRDKVVVGQPFEVTLSFGWDAGLAAKINHADLSLPWWGELSGAIEIESATATLGGRRVTVGLNGNRQVEVESLGRTTIGGRELVVYRLTQSYLATTVGALDFPVSHLEFGRVTSGSLFAASRTLEMYYKSMPSKQLEVTALPEAARPIEFGGAVGTISGSAKADRREVELGDSIKLEVTWSGDGNLEFFELPDLTHTKGFEKLRLFGATDKVKSRSARVSVFDLAPMDQGLTEIPSVPLWVFDPEQERYKIVQTQPIPIRVHALKGSGSLDLVEVPDPEQHLDDIRDLLTRGFNKPSPREIQAISPLTKRGALLPSAGLFVFFLYVFLRPCLRRGMDPAAPLERRRRKALRNFERSLRGTVDISGKLDALCSFLAARTRTRDLAWKGRRTTDMQGISLEADLVERLDHDLNELEIAAWGAQGHAPPDADLLELARALIKGGL